VIAGSPAQIRPKQKKTAVRAKRNLQQRIFMIAISHAVPSSRQIPLGDVLGR
jgi:hypothetical protein